MQSHFDLAYLSIMANVFMKRSILKQYFYGNESILFFFSVYFPETWAEPSSSLSKGKVFEEE